MLHENPSLRFFAGCAGLAAYLCAAIFAPLVHICVEHRAIAVDAAAVDPDRFKDEHGDVDLARLAAALGVEQESIPHSHAPGEPPHRHDQPLQHGQGAAQHFGIALLIAAIPVLVPCRPAPPLPAPLPALVLAPVLDRRELDSAWPQGPPV